MTRRHPALAHIYELQDEERQRRTARPDLALRYAIVDLVSGCATQYYAEHPLSDDLERLDRARDLLDSVEQYRSGSRFEAACLDAVPKLADAARLRREQANDLDVYDDLRRSVVEVSTTAILGREDGEAPGDLLCWNEANCLLEGVTVPYRCAAAISVLGHLGAADRYRVIDPMVDLRRRYEEEPQGRSQLDAEIRDVASEFVDWFGEEGGLVR